MPRARCTSFQSPRGDFGFLKRIKKLSRTSRVVEKFQSPRGDFGFLKDRQGRSHRRAMQCPVSIPSRGFWFFEAQRYMLNCPAAVDVKFQSPRGDFGFLKLAGILGIGAEYDNKVSIPSRGFWFFEGRYGGGKTALAVHWFQSPRGDFGFLESTTNSHRRSGGLSSFNPLAGILVF